MLNVLVLKLKREKNLILKCKARIEMHKYRMKHVSNSIFVWNGQHSAAPHYPSHSSWASENKKTKQEKRRSICSCTPKLRHHVQLTIASVLRHIPSLKFDCTPNNINCGKQIKKKKTHGRHVSIRRIFVLTQTQQLVEMDVNLANG